MSIENSTFGAVVHQFNDFSFGTVDYAVFVLMLSISLLIGVYFGFFGHGADNTEEYLLGGKRMKTIPIAFSLVARSVRNRDRDKTNFTKHILTNKYKSLFFFYKI